MSTASNGAANAYGAESIGAVLGRLRLGQSTASDEAAAALARSAVDPGNPAWIDRRSPEALATASADASARGPLMPLAGVPVAVKGNIDVAGLPTTAACPTFAEGPASANAAAVQRLVDAGAVVIGTTNLDQFATGLNGTRSPYGAPHAVGLPGRISGGSSSGSAVAVARGDVPLALGTDTAGSGRVPAALNGIVGLKPSRGLVSAAGVLPACRSLDVVSIFTADVDSAALALSVLAGPDAGDAWSRVSDGLAGAAAGVGVEAGAGAGALPAASGPGRVLRIGVPSELPTAHADPEALAAWEATVVLAAGLAAEVELVPIDMAPFYEAGTLLYGGAFVAERHASVGAFVEGVVAADPDDPSLDPTVRDIVLAGAGPSASQAFADLDRIRVLTTETHAVLADLDALLTPTVLEHPTHAELAADPVGANARLGLFTTFGNLLDLSVLALPGLRRYDGLPFGVSFHARAFSEATVLELGARLERLVCEAGGAVGAGAPGAASASAAPASTFPPAGRVDAQGRLLLAVGGAHMAGMPINAELSGEGGEYMRLTRTAPGYRLHVLDTPRGPRPGIERVGDGAPPAPGSAPGIEVEVWALDPDRLGSFIHRVPPQLALGPITLLDGSTILGFLGAAGSDVSTARLVESWRHFARGL